MHTFIAALAGLSLTSSVSAPLITNQVQYNNISSVKDTPLKTTRISFDGEQKLSVKQGFKSWETTFTLEGDKRWDRTGRITFEPIGLYARIVWGGESWEYKVPYLDVNADQTEPAYAFNERHNSGLASQDAHLMYSFGYTISTNRYRLSFDFYASSYNSFSPCTGELTIGTAMVFDE